MKILCEKNETTKIKGFKSKKKEGKTFEAKLTPTKISWQLLFFCFILLATTFGLV
ncbi:hypothetical protein [Oceanobacillus kimchii]|uniref:hypothetical protein n=1 Tax=Oceanobacillus kimchii TaxID=746691 RepID=UPI003C716E6B